MSNLAQRVLSAVLLLPLLLAAVAWRNPWGFAAVVGLAALVASGELLAMTLPGWSRGRRAAILGVAALAWWALYLLPGAAVAIFPAASMLTALLVLLDPGAIPAAGARLAFAWSVPIYVVALSVPLALLHRDVPQGSNWVFVVLAATFANDTGAYFAGRGFGRHKLYPAVSPGKTWEGAVGGLVASALALIAARATFFPSLTWIDVAAVAGPASVLGPVGDLVESLVKRAAGAKDSGRLIPGHGGLLDRIDALLFVGSWVFLYARFLR